MASHPQTFLFTDLENSTPLWEKCPEEMQKASARHDELLRQIIEEHGGRVIKTTGDGFHAVFSSPVDGVAATLAGQQVISSEPWPEETGPLKVRMGLHTGQGRERGGDYYGVDVNLAARIMGLGHGGQILLSETTVSLVQKSLPEDCSLLDLDQHRLKGIAANQHIFQLCHPTLLSDFPPLKSLAAYKHNLHRQLSTFIGREKEMAEVKLLLEDTRLLTLLGPGGTGKTRLMLQVAEEVIDNYPDGVWLVELASLTDPDLIPERVAGTLNVQEQPGRRLLDTLTEYLRRKELLLLLDNVEHLVAESAQFAEHLLDNCPKLNILVTGREALFIAGEITLQIPSLSLPLKNEEQSWETIGNSEGVQLFLDRGRAVSPDFRLTRANAAAIAEIVRRLDGIPLALELAAARLRMLTAQQIAERLNDRFRLLTGGRRTALPRQQTLQALIDWSWNLLDETERALLRRLSVFSGGWTLEAAQAVAGFDPLDEFAVFDGLEQLINKSLVTVQKALPTKVRYGMLESIRQYAQDKLIAAGEAAALHEKHVDYFVSLVDAYGEEGFARDYYAWRSRLALEGDNLRAVMDWIVEDRPALTLHFVGMLHQFETGWMHYREARSWLQPAVEQAQQRLDDQSADIDMTDFIRALQAYGWLLVIHGKMMEGHAILDECIQLAREHEQFRIMAFTLGMKAQAMVTTVTWDIIERMNEAIVLCRRNDYEIELLMLLFSAGQAYLTKGELEKGEEHLVEAINKLKHFDIPSMNAWAYIAQAQMAIAYQDFAEAKKHLLLAVDTYDKLGDQRMAVTARSMLAHIYRNEGKIDDAVSLYRQTILAWQEQGHQSAVAHQLECFAYIAIAEQQYETAAQLLGAANKARERLNAQSTDSQEIAELEQAMSQLEAEMGTSKSNQKISQGERMSLDEAVALALAEE